MLKSHSQAEAARNSKRVHENATGHVTRSRKRRCSCAILP